MKREVKNNKDTRHTAITTFCNGEQKDSIIQHKKKSVALPDKVELADLEEDLELTEIESGLKE